MIRSKDEIVFLTKNAMACISVTGAQYPVRDQKLVLLGEDVAVLEEAIRERDLFLGGSLNYEFELSEEYIEGHPDQTMAPASAILTPKQYDTRILDIRETVDGEYERIKAMLAGRNWIDRNEATAISSPENPVIQCRGAPTQSESSAARTRFLNTVDQCIADISDENTRHATALKDLKDAYNAAVMAENERFSKDSSIPEAREKRDEAFRQADAAYQSAKESEETRHQNEIAALKERLEREEITGPEYDELLAKEDELHGYALEKAANERVTATEKADTDYNVVEVTATKAHYDKLDELEQKYDEDTAEEDKQHDETVDGLVATRNAQLTEIAEDIPTLVDYMYNGGDAYSEAWRARDKAFEDAIIVKSCADAFYEKRYALWKPASTAIERVYGDFEHMNDVFNNGVHQLWRAAFQYGYNGQSHYFDSAVAVTPPGSSASSVMTQLSFNDEQVQSTFSNTDFYFMYGARYEADVIEKIVADVIIRRDDHKSANDRRTEIIDAGETEAIAAMSGVDDWRWRIVYVSGSGGEYEYVELFDTSGMTDDQINAANAKVDTANQKLRDAWHEASQVQDEDNRTICVSRVDFTKAAEQPNADAYAALDKIADRLSEGIAELAKARDETLGESEKEYQSDVAKADKDFDTDVELAKTRREEADERATASYVEAMWDVAKSTNSRVAAAETDEEREQALDEFERENALALQRLEDAKSEASKDYDEAVDAATEKRDKAREKAVQDREERDDEAEETYANAAKELRHQLSAEAQENVYNAHEQAGKQVEDAYSAARAQADAAYNEDVQAAEDGAIQYMTQHFGAERFESSDGWWFDGGQLWYGADADEDLKTAVRTQNASLSAAKDVARRSRNQAYSEAEAARWSARKSRAPLTPLARVKFEATIAPADSAEVQGVNQVWVTAVRNVEVVYAPRSATGADFSKYYEELREEKSSQG